jgi:hypothetical protein
MDIILKQRQGTSRKVFTLTDDMLKIKSWENLWEYKEWTVKLENTGNRKIVNLHSKLGPNIIAVIFLTIVLTMTVSFIIEGFSPEHRGTLILGWIVFGGLSLLIFLSPMKNEMKITGGQFTLSFFPDSPSRKEVDLFTDEIIRRSKMVLLRKYGEIDPDLPEETVMNQLNWLKNMDLIDEEQYLDLKIEYQTKKLINCSPQLF